MKKLLLILLCLPILSINVMAQEAEDDSYLNSFLKSSPNTYTMYKEGFGGIFGNCKKMRKNVIRKANEFATKHGKDLEVVSCELKPIFRKSRRYDYYSFTYVFKLASSNQVKVLIKTID